MYSKPIRQLIHAFSRLPSVGQRTAERFVFYLLKSGKKDVGELALALKQLSDTMKSCEDCFDFTDQTPCVICRDHTRDHTMVCVVAEPQDVQVLERAGSYRGVYYVLRGTLRADDMERLIHLKIPDLCKRVAQKKPQEIILALNPTLDGETTMMYLEKEIKQLSPDTTITRLARGLPMGSDLQYADDITLDNALKHRTNM